MTVSRALAALRVAPSSTRAGRRAKAPPEAPPVADVVPDRIAEAFLLAAESPEEAVAHVAGLLRDPDDDVRAAGADALARCATADAARALVGAAVCGSVPADRLVKRLGHPWAVDALVAAIAHSAALTAALPAGSGGSLRTVACGALERAGSGRAEPALLTVLADGNDAERVAAVRALGVLATTGAPAALSKALTDAAPEVRREAARGLGRLDAHPAAPLLRVALADPDRAVARAARRALVALGEADDREFERDPE